MRIPGQKRARQAIRRWRSRSVPGALILGYHRLNDSSADHYALSVTPAHFAEQLAVLRRRACPINLAELAEGVTRGTLPRRAVALSFDDGYAETLHQARPLLEHYQIPATVFVTTGTMGREFWWDELEQIIMTPAVLPGQLLLQLGGRVFRWEQRRNDVVTRRCLLRSLYQWFLPLRAGEQREGLVWLRVWAGVPVEVRACRRALWPREVRKLADSHLITVGAHSVTHPLLAHLPAAGQEAEIRESKATLEVLLERPISAFSYPNGSATAETEVLVREAGFTLACASDEDLVRQQCNPYRLPRFWVPDWDGSTFGRWLERWLRG